jgi:hypothetical protein
MERMPFSTSHCAPGRAKVFRGMMVGWGVVVAVFAVSSALADGPFDRRATRAGADCDGPRCADAVRDRAVSVRHERQASKPRLMHRPYGESPRCPGSASGRVQTDRGKVRAALHLRLGRSCDVPADGAERARTVPHHELRDPLRVAGRNGRPRKLLCRLRRLDLDDDVHASDDVWRCRSRLRRRLSRGRGVCRLSHGCVLYLRTNRSHDHDEHVDIACADHDDHEHHDDHLHD